MLHFIGTYLNISTFEFKSQLLQRVSVPTSCYLEYYAFLSAILFLSNRASNPENSFHLINMSAMHARPYMCMPSAQRINQINMLIAILNEIKGHLLHILILF